MNKLITIGLATTLLGLSQSSLAKDIQDPVAFIKQIPYHQVVKELALSRCLAQVSDSDKAFSLDAARTANAMREWMPFDIESGDEKINALIGKYKSRVNEFHSETKGKSQGVTLNCLRLYHSPELDKLSRQLIAGNPDRTWNQDNAK
ncbi:T6SS amidase immunity protein Tai4 family protein [Serratia nevei]|uniref:T6SS amidase immunity protein Tai4 family protein n=1 Tax=Serratia marcescens TaxID=615 RepID=UPI001A31D5E5|nr:T6SS amidase immunity protein Tai4 family protein [Serratia marcescens]MDF8322483.1 T6SS amidase immunity protein Tai4 family protein [Serratia nevei]MDF8340060.1 T6SS amidase immunity protein Tai4 family protein [Serratia nevei]MDF8342346.1 T6SS amidase immunity protein Tai4 family protein [Serratia nevei]MDF8351079.1 T6SS amidase immunity protein Tai4 family protein [Serratia nevei]MDP8641044.1 T6SS amidase immunity protein Tai4 family protein [Serratia marcescens]